MAVKKMTITDIAEIREELDSIFEKKQEFATIDAKGNIKIRKFGKLTSVIIVEALNQYQGQLAMLADISLENVVREIIKQKTKRTGIWRRN